MSRQTMMETLKGGILLMILLMIMLMLVGGFITWRYAKRAKGPEYKVKISLPAAVDPAKTVVETQAIPVEPEAWREGRFAIPAGTVDVAPSRVATREDMSAVPAEKSEIMKEAGLFRMLCRTFAPESDRTATVEACSYTMFNAVGAGLAFGRFATGPSNFEHKGIDGGVMTASGFQLVKGNRYLEVRRADNRDATRMAAIAFVEDLSTQVATGPDQFAGLLPVGGMIAGTRRVMTGAQFGFEFLGNVVTARYLDGASQMSVMVKLVKSPADKKTLLERCIEALRSKGGTPQNFTGLPPDSQLLQVGNSLVLVGSGVEVIYVIRDFTETGKAVGAADELLNMRHRILMDRIVDYQ